MTKDVFPERYLSYMNPELVAPMVVYLAHENCRETGKIYEAAGGWFGQGAFFVTPEFTTLLSLTRCCLMETCLFPASKC